MKPSYSFLLCALLATSSTATAQHAIRPETKILSSIPESQRPYLRYSATARQAGSLDRAPSTAKTTAMRERLIGYSVYDDLGELVDSAHFTYSGTRGSNHGANDLNSYFFSYAPENEHFPQTGGFQIFGTGGPLNILCDTGVLVSGDLEIYQTMKMVYNSVNKLQRYNAYYFSGGATDGLDEYRYTYNATGQTTKIENDYVSSGSGPATPYSVMYGFYNAAGKPVLDSLASLTIDPGGKITYTYNAAGLLTNMILFQEDGSGTFQPFLSIDYTHDASGRFETSTISADGGGGSFVPVLRDSLGYTGTYAFPTFTRLLQSDGTSFSPAIDLVYHVNAAGLRDTVTYTDYSTGSPEYGGKTWYTYTVGGNLKTTQSVDPAGAALGIDTYYYELFDDAPVSISPEPARGITATAYPNPATSHLTLQWNAAAAGPRVHVVLTDAAGRTLISQATNVPAGKADVDMSRLAPGLYTVTLSANNGTPLQSLKVTKQ